MARFGMRELWVRWRTSVGMIAAVAVAMLVFLALEGITRGAAAIFTVPVSANWIVQQEGSMGEFSGSRLPGEYEGTLLDLGAAVVPELHTITGTSFEDVTLVRGVPLDRYAQVERFEVTSGERLGPGDQGLAMTGVKLAETRRLGVGDKLDVRGQLFVIKGIFRAGTLADSEVWLPLDEAQALFGFGDDVSIYVAQGAEDLKPAIEAALPVEVSRQGEGFASFARSLSSMVRLLRVVSVVMAVAAALSILNVMFTVVQSRQRELAVLRAVGFGQRALVLYVMAQAGMVALLGYLASLLVAVGMIRGLSFEALGVSITPVLDGQLAAAALVLSLAIGLISGAYPAMRAAQVQLAEQLRKE